MIEQIARVLVLAQRGNTKGLTFKDDDGQINVTNEKGSRLYTLVWSDDPNYDFCSLRKRKCDGTPLFDFKYSELSEIFEL